jgi:hypothetical protein
MSYTSNSEPNSKCFNKYGRKEKRNRRKKSKGSREEEKGEMKN